MYKNFGEFLQQKREEKKVTLRGLAEKLDLSAPFLSDVEKDRRNPPEKEKLEEIAKILSFSKEDIDTMFKLAGQKRETIAVDLPDYIMERDYVTAALRTARELDADEEDWLRFVNELKERKG